MDTLTYIAVHGHSAWRWIVLLLLLVAVIKSFQGWKKNNPFTVGDKKVFMFAMVAFHIQFLGGWLLYFISPKVAFVEGMMKSSLLRFFVIEHMSLMLISFILISIGYSRSKKADEENKKFRTIFIFYTIALVLILMAIPWPFREALGAKWL